MLDSLFESDWVNRDSVGENRAFHRHEDRQPEPRIVTEFFEE